MNKLHLLVALLLMLPLAGCNNTPKETVAPLELETTFTNPFIFADVPDVAVIRVGGDYFMVSTTNHMMPGVPIMHSRDLVNWQIISYLYDENKDDPRYDLANGNVYSRGQWAASLRYHEGTFYVFFGTGNNNKSYIYSTKNPFEGWECILTLDEYLHDASLLFDDDGRIYLAYNGSFVKIIEFEKDLSGIKRDGLNVEVIHGEPKGLLEGAQMVKKDGKYYILMIWWPHGGIRTQVAFRSDKIDGPYEMKVILSDDSGFPRHGIAQGTVVDTEDGRWYGMLFQDHEAVGRTPMLMPCRWIDGWPMLGDENGKVPLVMEKPVQGYPATPLVVSDEFEDDKLGLQWQWNHNPENDFWSLTDRPGFLRLTTGRVVKNIFEASNTLAQRTTGPACEGTIKLDVANMKEGDQAGLSSFCSEPGAIAVVMEGGKKYLVMSDRLEEQARVELKKNVVYLKMDCDFHNEVDDVIFSYSLNGKKWEQLGPKFDAVFNTAHFTGNKFAIFNYATKEVGGYVDVDYFEFTQK